MSYAWRQRRRRGGLCASTKYTREPVRLFRAITLTCLLLRGGAEGNVERGLG